MDPVLAALRATDYPFDVVNCDPDLADTSAFCEHYGFALDDSANAILVAGKSEERPVVCCVVLASTRLDVNGVVRKRLGSRKASFASPEETMERSGGMMIGGVTPWAFWRSAGLDRCAGDGAHAGDCRWGKSSPKGSVSAEAIAALPDGRGRRVARQGHRLAAARSSHLSVCSVPARATRASIVPRSTTDRSAKLDRTLATCGRRAIWVRWIRS